MGMSSTHSPAERWASLAGGLPKTVPAYIEALNTLVEQADFVTADAGFDAVLAQFPANQMLASRYARAAEQRGDWPEAVRRWEAAHVRFPANLALVQGLAASLVRTGEPDRAEALIDGILQPADPAMRRLLLEYARLANSRRDFAAARERWKILLELAPDDKAVRNGWLEMQALERLGAVDTGGDDMPMPMPPSDEEAPHAALMTRFEGLGGTCEFGLVQRHFGAEPLGLLRWVTVDADKLKEALDSRLDGVGNAEFTQLRLSPANMFYTDDSRYVLAMNTFIRNIGQDQAVLATQLQRRMRFLRDKLLEDLTVGEKIFVYRCRQKTREEEILPIAASVQAYNPGNMLMAIYMLPHGAPGEKLRWLAPGVLCGGIGDGRRPSYRTGWDVDYDFWLQACQDAVAMIGEADPAERLGAGAAS